MNQRLGLAAMGIALANLAVLGLLIGWVGASRAYSVGLHTLLRDHLPAVAITLAATALLSFALGRQLVAIREIAAVVASAVAADVAAAVAVTLAIGEMRDVAAFALPRALFTETVGGLQLLAIAGGTLLGYIATRASGGNPEQLTSTDADPAREVT